MNIKTKGSFFQSGFHQHHSSETAQTKVLKDIFLKTDSHKITDLVLMDLSAATDVINCKRLLDRNGTVRIVLFDDSGLMV